MGKRRHAPAAATLTGRPERRPQRLHWAAVALGGDGLRHRSDTAADPDSYMRRRGPAANAAGLDDQGSLVVDNHYGAADL